MSKKCATVRVCAGAAAAAVAGIVMIVAPSSSAAVGVSVYGGPTHTPGVGGYKGQRDGWMTFNSFATVNDAGTAAGMTVKYDAAGTDLGTRAFRWDASGAAPVELGILGNAGQQLWRRRRCGD